MNLCILTACHYVVFILSHFFRFSTGLITAQYTNMSDAKSYGKTPHYH